MSKQIAEALARMIRIAEGGDALDGLDVPAEVEAARALLDPYTVRLKQEEKGPLFNQVTLVALSMGKAFPVRFICSDADEANRVMAKNDDVSLIAEDSEGRCYLADTYGGTVRSSEFDKLTNTL